MIKKGGGVIHKLRQCTIFRNSNILFLLGGGGGGGGNLFCIYMYTVHVQCTKLF